MDFATADLIRSIAAQYDGIHGVWGQNNSGTVAGTVGSTSASSDVALPQGPTNPGWIRMFKYFDGTRILVKLRSGAYSGTNGNTSMRWAVALETIAGGTGSSVTVDVCGQLINPGQKHIGFRGSVIVSNIPAGALTVIPLIRKLAGGTGAPTTDGSDTVSVSAREIP